MVSASAGQRIKNLRDVDWNKLKEWYNGYNFLGETVYNPFDILLFIDKGKSYRNYWFETGTPTFLVELMKRERYFLPDLDTIEVEMVFAEKKIISTAVLKAAGLDRPRLNSMESVREAK